MSLLFKLASLNIDSKVEMKGGAAPQSYLKYIFLKQHIQYIYLLLTIIISLTVIQYFSEHVIPEGLFETDDSDDEDKKKRRGMVALTSAYILVLVLVYIALNIIVVVCFGVYATMKDRPFMHGVNDWVKYFVKDGDEVFIASYVYIIGIILVLGIVYIFYTTVIDREFYNDIHFQSNVKLSEDDDDIENNVEEKTQADKYLYHYSFLLLFVGVFTICYTCFLNSKTFSFWLFVTLALYLTLSSLAITNLYRQERSKMLFYLLLQIGLTVFYIMFFVLGGPNHFANFKKSLVKKRAAPAPAASQPE